MRSKQKDQESLYEAENFAGCRNGELVQRHRKVTGSKIAAKILNFCVVSRHLTDSSQRSLLLRRILSRISAEPVCSGQEATPSTSYEGTEY